MFQTKFADKIKTRIFMFSNFFSPENRAIYEIMWEKYGRTRQATTAPQCYVYTYISCLVILYTRYGLNSVCLQTATFKHNSSFDCVSLLQFVPLGMVVEHGR